MKNLKMGKWKFGLFGRPNKRKACGFTLIELLVRTTC